MKAIELYRNDDHIILVTTIEFKYLKDVVKFTQRKSSNWELDIEVENEDSTKFYQRETNDVRVKNIKNYISESLFSEASRDQVLFPSSVILSIDAGDNELITNNNTNIIDVNFPIEKESCLIVDGQHRMKAMDMLYKEIAKSDDNHKLNKILNYRFNCTILVNYDIWEQAQIFASVNFNQKPVDRSLYFDIFGEVPQDGKDEKLSNLYIAHELGKYLNSSEKSPLKGFVKNFSTKQGFISQAFLMQAILNLLGPRGSWNTIVEDFKKTDEEKKDLHKKLPKVFVSYFNSIKNILPGFWPKTNTKEEATILTKTNSLGALIKLLGRINTMFNLGLFPKHEQKYLLDLSLNELDNLFLNIFKVFNSDTEVGKALSEKYFGKESRYAGGGSAGLQNQLFKELAFEIGIPVEKKTVNEAN